MREEPAIETDKPVLVFGGPYGNLHATKAVLAEAERLKIAPDHVVCTGDLVAYCGDPVATIDLVMESGIHVVMGNCDEQIALEAPDCGCGFPEGGQCARLASAWFAYAQSSVGAHHRVRLAQLPRRIDLDIAGIRLAVVHGGLGAINQFIFATTPAAAKMEHLEIAGCAGIIGGHCGLPFSQIVDGRLWHNAGVVGLPANDGTPRVWYSVLRPKAGGLEIEHRPLAYDHLAAAAAIRRAGLPVEYADALVTGLWPSCDVLPAHEKSLTGHALTPGTVFWRPASDRVGEAWPAHAHA